MSRFWAQAFVLIAYELNFVLEMPVSQDEFRNALSRFPSGVTVVTTMSAGGVYFGITVSAFCSVSLEPPLVLICIEKDTGSHHAFFESRSFVVNILSHLQPHLSERFAAPADDKFGDIEFYTGLLGMPMLIGASVNLECTLENAYDGGDHTIFVGRVENAIFGSEEPLVYSGGAYGQIKEK